MTVRDSFNRADTVSGLGTADTGQTWTMAVGDMHIVSGRAVQDLPAVGYAYATIDHGTPSGILSVVVPGQAQSGVGNGLVARYADASNLWGVELYRSLIPPYHDLFYFFKIVAGVYTYFTNAVDVAPVNYPATVSLEMRGASLVPRVNGVTYGAPTTDSFNSTVTRHGLLSQADTVSTPSVNPMDNFTGVPIGATAGTLPLFRYVPQIEQVFL